MAVGGVGQTKKVAVEGNKDRKKGGCGRDRWEGKSRKKGREKRRRRGTAAVEVPEGEKRFSLGSLPLPRRDRRKEGGEFSQRRLVGEEAFRYDYHSFTSLVNI